MLKYNGKGFFGGDEFHDRVPARDLSDEEVKEFGKEFLLGLGIFDEVKEKKVKEEKIEVKYGK